MRREGGERAMVVMMMSVDGGGLHGRRGGGVSGGVIVYVCSGVRRRLWSFRGLPCKARRCVELWSEFYLWGFSRSVL